MKNALLVSLVLVLDGCLAPVDEGGLLPVTTGSGGGGGSVLQTYPPVVDAGRPELPLESKDAGFVPNEWCADCAVQFVGNEHRDCGPTDGPAEVFELATTSMGCNQLGTLRFSLWLGDPTVGTYVLSSGFQEGTGMASLCGDDQCTPSSDGSVTIDAVDGTEVDGHFSVKFAGDAAPRVGRFVVIRCGDRTSRCG